MEEIDQFFEKIASLPMMPKVIQEILMLLESDDVNVDEIIKKLSLDQVLSAKVLRLSNASYFGRSGSISNLSNALKVIGLSNLKTLVIASGITAAFAKVDGVELNAFWKKSIMVASITRQICKINKLDPESGYLAGLMNNIGQLPMAMLYPNIMRELNQIDNNLSPEKRCEVEQEKLNINHCMIGAELAKRWLFPESIQSAIRHYATPLVSDVPTLASAIYIANQYASAFINQNNAKSIVQMIHPDIANELDMNEAILLENFESYQAIATEAALAL
jgi:HD-like signal output (HDOD) protein